jgi:DNA-binding MarR family transcriptional regulator
MPTPPPVTLDEVLRAAEFRRLLRRFLAHCDVRETETRSIGQLTDDLQLAQSSVTELVDRAEAAGLVVRAAGNADARTVLVRLSPAGEDRLALALTAVRAEREQLLEHLDRARVHL